MTMLLKQLIVFVILGISVRRGDCCSIQDLITDETIVPGSTITKYVGENFDGLVAQYRVTDGSAQGGENSYCECGAECTSKVPFTVNQDGDIHEVIYRRPVNEENFFDKNPIFGPVFTLVMVCPGPVITPVLFVLQDANNNSPRFNLDGSSVSIEVPRHLKKGSSLVQYLSNPVWAYDEDVNETTNGRIDFKTDSSDFTVETLVSNAHGKPIFVPDIRLEKDAALYEPVQQSFVLTAEDQGEGFNTAVLTFSVTFAATENLYPPLFVNPVYEFVIPEQQFTGEVAKIEAFDGDGTQAITYEIQYNLGLDISVDEQGSVKLNTVVPTDFLERKALVILITAREVPTGSLDPKSSDVPLVLILPDPTDVTTTMSPCNSCPPCVCTTEAPTTPGPSLTFERQQYNAEVVENVQGYNILTVKAEHSGEMTVSYALDIGQDNAAFGRFIISELGVISTTQPLPIEPKYYVFNATAFAGGLADNALIQIQVISGVNCGQPLFQEVFFIADLNEEERKSNFMQVYVANPSNVLYYISDVEPEDYYGAFEIHNTTGFISCIEEVNREDYSEVILTIEAREKIQMVKKAEFSLATALVRIQDVNDNKPLFVDSPRVVAYPSGATFDESVSSPLAKFYAEDLDIGQNAEIVYSVDSTYFFMEEATGVLFATKTSLNCGIEECNINIYATDKGKPPLQSDPLSVSIKILSDEYIFVITVVGKNGTPLSPSNVTSELSSKIGYEVLLISAQPEISAKSFAEKTFSSEELSVSLFAMKEEDPVRREDFIRDYNAIEPSITLFERKGVIRQPDHGNQGQAGSDDLLAATIALSIVLGLVIAGGVAGFLYMRSKNELRRSSSTDHLRLQSEGESSTHSGETTIAIMPRVDEKKFGDSQIFQSEPKKIPNFTPDFIEFTNPSFEDDDIQKSTETSPDTPAIEVTDLDNSAPQTPRPVKSAIKNSMLDDDEGKEKKGGVRFDAEPEVFETDLESSKIQNDFL
ncbi:cadherin EGF LAG seven-pass G-type receptor 3-like isoform X18 [Artemia franciscana]|uniref:cadherin EGF LAG seven-pass G-type receptor 3-like isoform X18 n=1 Tax=Artemia franciscana TaxID=6661 RepID=UPI0032DB3AC0